MQRRFGEGWSLVVHGACCLAWSPLEHPPWNSPGSWVTWCHKLRTCTLYFINTHLNINKTRQKEKKHKDWTFVREILQLYEMGTDYSCAVCSAVFWIDLVCPLMVYAIHNEDINWLCRRSFHLLVWIWQERTSDLQQCSARMMWKDLKEILILLLLHYTGGLIQVSLCLRSSFHTHYFKSWLMEVQLQ